MKDDEPPIRRDEPHDLKPPARIILLGEATLEIAHEVSEEIQERVRQVLEETRPSTTPET